MFVLGRFEKEEWRQGYNELFAAHDLIPPMRKCRDESTAPQNRPFTYGPLPRETGILLSALGTPELRQEIRNSPPLPSIAMGSWHVRE
ncbi:hypothetical protein RFN25_31165 [Mesorhizobium abyssinicae]|nr:hypothetical protein [Mesorhizobium abyssinicae]